MSKRSSVLFISLDSILDAVHVSYDRILSMLEQGQLIRDLQALLSGARSHLKDPGLETGTARDLDVFLGVAWPVCRNRACRYLGARLRHRC